MLLDQERFKEVVLSITRTKLCYGDHIRALQKSDFNEADEIGAGWMKYARRNEVVGVNVRRELESVGLTSESSCRAHKTLLKSYCA
jgi:hypothetical protein